MVPIEAPLTLGAGATTPRMSTITVNGQPVTLTIEPGAVRPGEAVAILAEGLTPNLPAVTMQLVDAGGSTHVLPDAPTDGNGRLAAAFYAPSLSDGPYTVRVDVPAAQGALGPSPILTLGVSLMGETLLLALMGTIIAVLVSLPLSLLGAFNLMGGGRLTRVIYALTRAFFTLVRSVEVLIVALLLVVVVGTGPLAGMLALVVHSVGALGKLFSEAIEGIESGPVEAITATGASRAQTVLFAVLPQVVPRFVALTLSRWDGNLRMATVIGLVGGGGIGSLLIQHVNLLQWEQAATLIWLIAIVVSVMDFASVVIRRWLV
jgi:phosphonate ABC transporter permease subunit PhnE